MNSKSAQSAPFWPIKEEQAPLSESHSADKVTDLRLPPQKRQVPDTKTPAAVRELQTADISVLRDYFNSLGVEHRRNRLHATTNAIPDSVLSLFFSPSTSTHFVYAGLAESTVSNSILDNQKMIAGEVMLAGNFSSGEVEVGLSTNSAMVRCGIGRLLLLHAIDIAQQNGFQKVYADTSRSNKAFLGLAASCGFELSRHPDDWSLYRLTKALTPMLSSSVTVSQALV